MILLVGAMLAMMVSGVPIAFAIGASATLYLIIGDAVPLMVVAQRMVVGVDSFTLLAIPLFLLGGALMAAGEITPKIMRFAYVLVGWIPGGLAMVLVVSCMLFGAISGSGVADVVAIGSIVVPMMNRQGYRRPFTAALLGCAGSLGTIIPPSMVMVILGVTMGASIGKLFIGGIVPGILLGIFLMALSYYFARKENYPRGERPTWKEVKSAFREALLPLGAPFLIVAGFRSGIFTATETGAVVALYALILSAFVYRKLTLSAFLDVCYSVGITSASVLLIISSASLFGWILAADQIPQKVATFILSVSKSYWGILIMFNILLLILGTFMETIAVVIIIVPIFMPIMQQIGVDPIHLGVMIAVNLAIGANSPPLGVDLITACKVTDTSYESSFPFVFPFIGSMAAALMLIIAFPGLVTYLPNLLVR
jgi:tripartite ATP-independent transporter DctM subunit